MKVLMASAIIFYAFIYTSCKEGTQKEPAMPMNNEMHQVNSNNGNDVANNAQQNINATAIIDEYLSIKDALVADNSEMAAKAGNKLVKALEKFELSSYSGAEQNEMKDILVHVKEQADHISDGSMEQQREHFKTLSTIITDMVAITETDKKLYQQFCPMYDNGSVWLSASNKVQNPYYGSKMLNCGKVQREIN